METRSTIPPVETMVTAPGVKAIGSIPLSANNRPRKTKMTQKPSKFKAGDLVQVWRRSYCWHNSNADNILLVKGIICTVIRPRCNVSRPSDDDDVCFVEILVPSGMVVECLENELVLVTK